jgi:excisionase family DNA binding protein
MERHGAAEEPWLLRVDEVSRLLSLGRTRTWELIWKRELPVVRMGRSVRISRVDLLRWIRAHAEGSLTTELDSQSAGASVFGQEDVLG